MALAHTLGFARIGADRELKKALAAYGKGNFAPAGLQAVGREQRPCHWQLQRKADIDLLPVGFDTDAHDLAPEFFTDQAFAQSWQPLFDEVDEAHALGHQVKPVIIGPLTYLWLGKAKGAASDKLESLERLLPIYGEVLNRLKAQGVEWVQIDEPILSLDLPVAWKSAFERAYHILQYSPLKKLVATCFSGLADNLGLAAGLPVDGLHIDAVRAPEELGQVLDRLPSYKILSVGLVDGRNAWRCELEQALAQLRPAQERFGDNLWVGTSRSLVGQAGGLAP